MRRFAVLSKVPSHHHMPSLLMSVVKQSEGRILKTRKPVTPFDLQRGDIIDSSGGINDWSDNVD
jgi:hypothetical protein